jgi:hypothetical protein
MLGLIKLEAAKGNKEAVHTLATLRSMGLIKDEPVEPKETPTWELLAMCVARSRQRKRNDWKHCSKIDRDLSYDYTKFKHDLLRRAS